MKVQELDREQLIQLKVMYMAELQDSGEFGEIVHNDPSITSPSWSDLADADDLIPDDAVYNHYDGIEFSVDDFN